MEKISEAVKDEVVRYASAGYNVEDILIEVGGSLSTQKIYAILAQTQYFYTLDLEEKITDDIIRSVIDNYYNNVPAEETCTTYNIHPQIYVRLLRQASISVRFEKGKVREALHNAEMEAAIKVYVDRKDYGLKVNVQSIIEKYNIPLNAFYKELEKRGIERVRNRTKKGSEGVLRDE